MYCRIELCPVVRSDLYILFTYKKNNFSGSAVCLIRAILSYMNYILLKGTL